MRHATIDGEEWVPRSELDRERRTSAEQRLTVSSAQVVLEEWHALRRAVGSDPSPATAEDFPPPPKPVGQPCDCPPGTCAAAGDSWYLPAGTECVTPERR